MACKQFILVLFLPFAAKANFRDKRGVNEDNAGMVVGAKCNQSVHSKKVPFVQLLFNAVLKVNVAMPVLRFCCFLPVFSESSGYFEKLAILNCPIWSL